MQTFETLEDSAFLVQLQMIAAASALTDLLLGLLPFITPAQAGAISGGMASTDDCPTALFELRACGPRLTVVAYVKGEPVVLAEHTSPPVPIRTANPVNLGVTP